MAEKTLKSNPISDYLKKRQSEKPPKEEKRSRKEERERFKKRLASLTPAEQKYLKRKRAFDTVWPVCRALLVIGLCFVIIYPLLYMITAAFRPRSEMNDPTIIWISKSFTTSNIKDVVRVMNFWHTLGNTLFINIGCSIVQVITCAITGYGFGRFNFKGKNILFGVVIMMIRGSITDHTYSPVYVLPLLQSSGNMAHDRRRLHQPHQQPSYNVYARYHSKRTSCRPVHLPFQTVLQKPSQGA